MICSGALLYAKDTSRFLFLHRTQGKRSNVWGLPGGTNESGETPWGACEREILEEIGTVSIEKILPLERFCAKDGHFEYHTYFCLISHEFIPTLNEEHNGYAWVSYTKWPNPLHYGLKSTLQKRINQIKIQTVLDLQNKNLTMP